MNQLYNFKFFICLLSTVIFVSCAPDSNYTNNKDIASKNIDMLYQKFAKAYSTFDVDLVSNLYTEDAHYLPGNPNQSIYKKRDAIRESFNSYFELVDSNDRDLKISFRIIKRNIDDSLAYDVGYYLIQTKMKEDMNFTDDGNVGKFVTVMGLQNDGRWRFLLDGYSSAPFMAFIADSSTHNPVWKE